MYASRPYNQASPSCTSPQPLADASSAVPMTASVHRCACRPYLRRFAVIVDRLLACQVYCRHCCEVCRTRSTVRGCTSPQSRHAIYGTRFTGGGVQVPSRIDGGVVLGA